MVGLFRFGNRRKANSSRNKKRFHASTPSDRQFSSLRRDQQRGEPSSESCLVTSTFGEESERELHLANQTFVSAEPISTTDWSLQRKPQSMLPRANTTSHRVTPNHNAHQSSHSDHPWPNTGHRSRRLGLQEEDCTTDQCSIVAPSFRHPNKQFQAPILPKRKRKQDLEPPSISRARVVESSATESPLETMKESKGKELGQKISTRRNSVSSKQLQPNEQDKERFSSMVKRVHKPQIDETRMVPPISNEDQHEEIWNALELHPKLQQALLDVYWQRREQELLEKAAILRNRDGSKLKELNPQVEHFLMEQGMALESIYELQKRKEQQRFQEKRKYFDTPHSHRMQSQDNQSRSSQRDLTKPNFLLKRVAKSEYSTQPPPLPSRATEHGSRTLSQSVSELLEKSENESPNSSICSRLHGLNTKPSTPPSLTNSFASAETPDTRPLIFKEIPTGKEGYGQVAAVGRPLPDSEVWEEGEEVVLREASNESQQHSFRSLKRLKSISVVTHSKSEKQVQDRFSKDRATTKGATRLSSEELGLDVSQTSDASESSKIPFLKILTSECNNMRQASPVSITSRKTKEKGSRCDANSITGSRSQRIYQKITVSPPSSPIIRVSPMNMRRRFSDITMNSPAPGTRRHLSSRIADFDGDEEYEYEIIEEDCCGSISEEQSEESADQNQKSYSYQEIIDKHDLIIHEEKHGGNPGLNPEDFEYYYEEIEESYDSDEMKDGECQGLEQGGAFSKEDYMSDEQLKVWISAMGNDPPIRVEGQDEDLVVDQFQPRKHCTRQEGAVDVVQRSMQKALHYLQKAMEAALSGVAIRSCPHCMQAFVKNDDGCNKMTCPTCKKTSCCNCRQIIPKVGYDHFENRLGANKYCLESKCPLWTDKSVDKARDQEELRNIIMGLATTICKEHLNANSEIGLGADEQFSESSIDSSVAIFIAKLPSSEMAGDEDESSKITRISI